MNDKEKRIQEIEEEIEATKKKLHELSNQKKVKMSSSDLSFLIKKLELNKIVEGDMIHWKALIRDVIIIFVLTGIGGFLIGLAAAGGNLPIAVIGVSNIIFSIVGFTISGCMAKVQRFRHLLHVALAVWLLSAFNMLLIPAIGLAQWLAGIVVLMISMAIGGALSFIFVKTPEENCQQHV